MRAIGIYSAQRSPVAPEIPTFVEQGMPKAVLEAWVTLIGPKGVPAATVKKVNAAAVQALASAAAKDLLIRQGTSVAVSTPEVARETIDGDLVRFAALVKKIGLEPQ